MCGILIAIVASILVGRGPTDCATFARFDEPLNGLPEPCSLHQLPYPTLKHPFRSRL